MKKAKKASPYVVFKDWLFNPNPNSVLDDWVIKAINQRSVLSSMGNLHGVTIFLNKHFNSFDVMMTDKLEFFTFIRNLIKDYRVKKNELSFFKAEKADKNLKQLQSQLPHLKQLEIGMLLELAKEDAEFDEFSESLGLTVKKKKKKMTKKEKTQFKNIKEEHQAMLDAIPRTYESYANLFELKTEYNNNLFKHKVKDTNSENE